MFFSWIFLLLAAGISEHPLIFMAVFHIAVELSHLAQTKEQNKKKKTIFHEAYQSQGFL